MVLMDQGYVNINTCYQTIFRKLILIYILCSCSLAIQYDFCNESYWDSKIYFLEFEFYAVLVPVLYVLVDTRKASTYIYSFLIFISW